MTKKKMLQVTISTPEDREDMYIYDGAYGSLFWCVKTPLSEDGEIYLYADLVRVQDNGALVFLREAKPEQDGKPAVTELITLALAPGQWTVFYAASCLGGHPVSVEHWKGEIHPWVPE